MVVVVGFRSRPISSQGNNTVTLWFGSCVYSRAGLGIVQRQTSWPIVSQTLIIQSCKPVISDWPKKLYFVVGSGNVSLWLRKATLDHTILSQLNRLHTFTFVTIFFNIVLSLVLRFYYLCYSPTFWCISYFFRAWYISIPLLHSWFNHPDCISRGIQLWRSLLFHELSHRHCLRRRWLTGTLSRYLAV